MGTRVLAITLRPELVALVTGPANPPPDGTRRTGGPASRSVRVLAVLLLWAGPGKMRVVNADVLLELL
jgi:hypothetical protein